MRYEHDIIIILDSILDDYCFLWECFVEYKRLIPKDDSKSKFIEALKEAYEKKYFDFFIGKYFNGDEELIPKFDLSDSTIEELLDYKNELEKEIRVNTSKLGMEFLRERFFL